MPPTTMKHLVTLRDGFEAKVLAARLGSEGVLVELRGSVDGMYPLGQIHVYVEESGLETAQVVLALSEDPASEALADDVAHDDEELGSSRRARRKLLAVLAVGLVSVLVLLELVRHAGDGGRAGEPSGAPALLAPAA